MANPATARGWTKILESYFYLNTLLKYIAVVLRQNIRSRRLPWPGLHSPPHHINDQARLRPVSLKLIRCPMASSLPYFGDIQYTSLCDEPNKCRSRWINLDRLRCIPLPISQDSILAQNTGCQTCISTIVCGSSHSNPCLSNLCIPCSVK
jgi:hypothetical protein